MRGQKQQPGTKVIKKALLKSNRAGGLLPPSLGYPLLGCSPALPNSVSPNSRDYREERATNEIRLARGILHAGASQTRGETASWLGPKGNYPWSRLVRPVLILHANCGLVD
jgi:hypothetical protein